ncbi:MAG TPA: DUF4249 family protein [Haliscomenobacter sp.]|mgnify:CR=1 FL=1|uniref:DUF4249 family protein n=1 Tax=Haliscomenobacter sp. TaxID=2717303 RepID=UPI002BCE2FF7|nr:DUF4249 family protein [Haliscomenobacter sp.]HOY17190.1 DUF4249 family protein [Haliscomenobacter sp.]HPH18863.1 DUF4249 family protein [Haliscomenobacter sp.]
MEKYTLMQYRRLALALLFGMIFQACEDSGAVTFNDEPVVEGYLYADNPVELKISRKSPFATDLNLDPKDLDALGINIRNGSQSYRLVPQGDGVYRSSNDGLQIEVGQSYQLEFEFKGKTVSAETVVLSKPEGFTQDATSIKIPQISFPPSGSLNFPDPVKFSWSNPDLSYYLLVVENTETDPDPIFDISNFGGRELPSRLFRVEPRQNNASEINSRQFQYYGKHRIILYHINPEYALLYQDSGDNSQNLKSPPTNVKNGLGIFTAISSDTLYLNVTQ